VYSLEFSPLAKKEYDRLEKVVQIQRLKKLKSRLHEPRVQADKLRNMPNCYKVKLRALGVRLVYEVIDRRLVVSVVAVGRRDNDAIYERAKGRIGRPD
jgi:mRNA interferase RelE/StbE